MNRLHGEGRGCLADRRRTMLLRGAALGGVLLGACGPGPEPSGQTPAASKQPVTLAVGAGGFVSPEDLELHRSVWRAFQEHNPRITLQVDEVFNGSTTKLLTMVAAGTSSDAAYVHPNDLATVASQGAYQNLDTFIKGDRTIDMKVYYPTVLEYFKFKGVLYQMPYYSGPSVLYYNKSLLKRLSVKLPEEYEKAGQWDWRTGFVEAHQRLTQSAGGTNTYGSDGRTGLAFLCIPIWCNGGEILNKELTESRLHTAPSAEAIQTYADLWARHKAIHPSGDWVRFQEGTIGLVFGGRFQGPTYRTIKDFEVGMWHHPRGPAGTFTRNGPNGYGVITGGQHPAEGWEFVKFYSGPVAQVLLFSGGRNVPATTRKEDLEAFRKSLAPWENEQVYLDATKRLRPLTPLPAKWGEINKLFGDEWKLLTAGEKQAQQAMTEIKPQLDALLKQG
ncbi:MAG: ABC transporter substrate-binding protein [Chloroflexota bacterium]